MELSPTTTTGCHGDIPMVHVQTLLIDRTGADHICPPLADALQLIAGWLHQVSHSWVSKLTGFSFEPLNTLKTNFVFPKFALLLFSHKAIMVFHRLSDRIQKTQLGFVQCNLCH